MMVLLGFVGATVFLFGLYQWALGGASLWRIFTLRRAKKKLTSEEREQADLEVKQLEQAADRTISASLKIIAILGVLVWTLLGMQMILELFGINMMGRISSTARGYWSQSVVQSGPNKKRDTTKTRNDMLKNMSSGLRK